MVGFGPAKAWVYCITFICVHGFSLSQFISRSGIKRDETCLVTFMHRVTLPNMNYHGIKENDKCAKEMK